MCVGVCVVGGGSLRVTLFALAGNQWLTEALNHFNLFNKPNSLAPVDKESVINIKRGVCSSTLSY